MTITLFQRASIDHPCFLGSSTNTQESRDAKDAAGTTAVDISFSQPAQTSDDPRLGWTSDQLGADGSDWSGTWSAHIEITAIGGNLSATAVWARRQSDCTFVAETQTGDTVAGTGVHLVDAVANLGAGTATDRAQFKLHLANSHMMNAQLITFRFNLSTHDIVAPITVAAGPPEVTATIPLGLDVGADTQTDHSATADVPLGLAVDPIAQTDHSATADIALSLAVDPVTQQPVPEVTTTIPVGLDVGADTQTDHSATADVPVGLAVDPVTQAPGGVSRNHPGRARRRRRDPG